MGIAKTRLVVYLTDQDKENIRARASNLGKNMSDYILELAMWDRRYKVIENARDEKLAVVEGGQ